MQFVEVMVAVVVFSSASLSSVQLWSKAARSHQQALLAEQQLERIELDRFQLQAHWRRARVLTPGCSTSAEHMRSVAQRLPVPPQLQRELLVSELGEQLKVRWHVEGAPELMRERVFTPAGLGLCSQEGSAT